MTQIQRDCAKMIALFLVVCAALSDLTAWFIERGRLVAVAHGCHSPRCIQWSWWFQNGSGYENAR